MAVQVPTAEEFRALEARVAALEADKEPPYAAILDPASGGDDTAMINDRLSRAATHGGIVYAPGGNVWRHDGMLEIPGGVTLQGDGETSEFRATNQATDGWPHLAIHLTGYKPGLIRVRVTNDWTGERQGTPTAQAVWVDQADGFVVDAVHVMGAAAGGVFCERSNHGVVSNCHIEDTLADGIGIGYSGSSFNTAVNNMIERAGDDGISVVSYTDDPQSTSNVIQANEVLNGRYARGIVDVGGKGTVIRDNTIENMPACGILTIEDAFWGTYASTDAVVRDNQVSGCAQPGSGYAANYQFDVGTQNATALDNVSTNPGGGHYAVHETATVTGSGNQPPGMTRGIPGPVQGKKREHQRSTS